MLISGFDNIGSIYDIELRKGLNVHSVFRFKTRVEKEQVSNYMSQVGKEITVCLDFKDLSSSDQDLKKLVFCGFVDNINATLGFSSVELEILAKSYSALEDETTYSRIFQNPQKRISDIADSNRLKLRKCNVDFIGSIKDKILNQVVVQNQETNYSFLKRLSHELGVSLWIKDTFEDKTTIVMGNSLNIAVELSLEEILRCQKRRTRESYSLWIVTKKYFEIGRIISFKEDGRRYVIVSMSLRYVNNNLEYSYVLDEYSEQEDNDKHNVLLKTIKFQAKVVSAEDPEHQGRLQVAFVEEGADGVLDMDKNDRYWFPYRTPYSGKNSGMVFVPDVGDLVEVFFSNEECYVSSSKRQNALLEECQNISDKYIGNNFSQRIIWKNDSLELKSFGNQIILNKEKIEIIVGKSVITITENNIDLKQNNCNVKIDMNNINLHANKEINICSKDLVKVDYKNCFSVKGNSVAIESSKIDLKSGDIKMG